MDIEQTTDGVALYFVVPHCQMQPRDEIHTYPKSGTVLGVAYITSCITPYFAKNMCVLISVPIILSNLLGLASGQLAG